MKYKQLSIYDFISEEKSQEVQPSETVPQVDEAQEYIIPAYPQTVDMVIDMVNYDDEKYLADLIASKNNPSSDLDTRKTWEKIVDFEKSLAKKKPTESTDLTLFSVGDVLTVKSSSYYSEDTHPEDYYHLKEFEGSSVTITSVLKGGMRGIYYGTNLRGNRGEVVHFYHRELE